MHLAAVSNLVFSLLLKCVHMVTCADNAEVVQWSDPNAHSNLVV